jgi:methionyl-tRNA formyltransferase
VTHTDNPQETIWFDSVAQLAAEHDIPTATPSDPNDPEFVARVRALAPDFLFSFYYRNMLQAPLLATAARGALNMHGSLLPNYRGRVPVNWAVLHGETQTGASLHYMEAKPDAGDLVDQQAVPILPNDSAADVFHKVNCAAEIVLHRSLPGLIAGTAPRTPLDLRQGSYFGGRKAEDGRIDWSQPAQAIHNLIRAVAPPYPGAFTTLAGRPLRILKSRFAPERTPRSTTPMFYCDAVHCYADCADGQVLTILHAELDGAEITPATFGTSAIPLGGG